MQTAVSSRTQKLIAAGAIVALALLSLQAYTLVADGSLSTAGIHNASGSTDPATNSTITVTGTGQVQLAPDLALITVGVNTQDVSAQAAAQQNANTMTNVIIALEKIGINSSSIQTVSYSVNAMTDYSQGASKLVGYQVDNEIQVTISVSSQAVGQLGSKAGAVIDAAVGQGANQVYGVQFTVSNAEVQQANQQALILAVQNAAGQAKAIAAALNVTITHVISVTTSPAYTPGPINYAVAGVANQTPIIAPQSLTISASIQAVYEIS